MIRDDWQTWVYMFLATAVVLWTIALFGCAAEPEAPIQKYRQEFGFTP